MRKEISTKGLKCSCCISRQLKRSKDMLFPALMMASLLFGGHSLVVLKDTLIDALRK